MNSYRQSYYRNHGINTCTCNRCNRDFGFITMYPLINGLCGDCRKEKHNVSLPVAQKEGGKEWKAAAIANHAAEHRD